MFTHTLIFLALVMGQASANVIQALQGRSSAIGRSNFARQNSPFNPASIPQQCQSTCAGTSTVLSGQGCQTDACLCTSSINTGFQQCLNCVLSLSPPDASLLQQSQAALQQYEDACASVGIPVASLTLSGATAIQTTPGSVSIPTISGGVSSPSIFFSSPGSTPSATASQPSSAGGGALNPPPNTSQTRSIITPGSNPTDTPAPGNNNGGSGNGTASGGERAYMTMSGLLGAGLVTGAMMVMGL